MRGVRRVLVVGAGTAGCAAAVGLSRAGAAVDVVEARADALGTGSGILLQGNALRALRATCGGAVTERVIASGSEVNEIAVTDPAGHELAVQPDLRTGGPDLPATLGVMRPVLQRALLDAVTAAGVHVRTGRTVAAVEDAGGRGVRVRLSTGEQAHYNLVVGADGAGSATRARVTGDRPRETGMAVWRTVVPRPAGVDRVTLAYGGPAYIAGHAPMGDDLAYAMLVVPADGVAPPREQYARRMRQLADAYGGPVWKHIRAHLTNPEVHFTPFATLLCTTWHRGRIVLIGDAAHHCPPTLAQGAAMVLEDAQVLAEALTGPTEVEQALAA